jgi:hypothetical protein
MEDRCQVLFLLNQLIQPCQLINHIYPHPFDPPAPSIERCLTLGAMPFALCPFCPQPTTYNLQLATPLILLHRSLSDVLL